MCMMIYQPQGKTISAVDIRRSVVMNPDGWGVIYRSADGTIKTKIDLNAGTAEGFMSTLGEHELVFHARAGSSGTRSWTNVHPFDLRLQKPGKQPEIWHMAHNGVFNQQRVPIDDERFSDTWHFARMIERAQAERKFDLQAVLENDELLEEFEWWIGRWNKLCFAGPRGFYIVNRHMGCWVGGLWYSNDSLFYNPSNKHARKLETATSIADAIGKAQEQADLATEYPSTADLKPPEAIKVIREQILAAADPYDCALTYACDDPQAVAIMLQDAVYPPVEKEGIVEANAAG